MRTELHPSDREHRAVLDHLEAWETRELLTHDEAEAIRTFELQHEVVEHRVPQREGEHLIGTERRVIVVLAVDHIVEIAALFAPEPRIE